MTDGEKQVEKIADTVSAVLGLDHDAREFLLVHLKLAHAYGVGDGIDKAQAVLTETLGTK